jgi:hypothetical protein
LCYAQRISRQEFTQETSEATAEARGHSEDGEDKGEGADQDIEAGHTSDNLDAP